MKRTALKRRTPLKRGRGRRPIKPAQMVNLVQKVMLRDGRCVAADHDSAMCDGQTEAHHVIAQRVLKRHFEQDSPAFIDGRGCVALCRTHHQLVESGFLHLPEYVLPIGFWGYLRDYGLEAEYDAMIARRVA